jgi:hypothetical protein
MKGEMYLGVLPPAMWKRVRPMSVGYRYANGVGAAAISPWLWPFVYLEAMIVTSVASSHWWCRMCLPSSNGFWSARALAKMYGALANEGMVEGEGGEEERIIDAAVVRTLKTKIAW